jgi:uncharacterized membrane protein YebE (DUF533 family)
MPNTSSANEINDIIKRAIDKQEISSSDYERILSLADSDGYIDAREKAAIAHLRDMIQDRTIKVTRSDA